MNRSGLNAAPILIADVPSDGSLHCVSPRSERLAPGALSARPLLRHSVVVHHHRRDGLPVGL